MTTDKQGASALPHGLPVTVLTSGAHASPVEGLCLIEAVAFHAGVPHSDHAEGVCPVLGAFGRPTNDGPWPSNEARTEALGPLVALLAGSRSTSRVERARAVFLARRALTAYAPLALYAAVCALESCGVDCADLRAAAVALCERPSQRASLAARDAARDATRAAAIAKVGAELLMVEQTLAAQGVADQEPVLCRALDAARIDPAGLRGWRCTMGYPLPLETVHGQGYAFAAPIVLQPAS